MHPLVRCLLLCLFLPGPAPAAAARTVAAAEKTCELIVVQRQAWLLAADGHLRVYDASGQRQHLPAVEAVTAEHLAADGDRVVAQIGPALQRWNSGTASWETVGRLARNVFGLVVTSRHQFFAITEAGVLDVASGYSKLPSSSPNRQLRQLTGLGRPTAYFMDSQDNLWLGFGYGEWGGNVFTYSTRQHKFLDLHFNAFRLELSPVKSFFQLAGSVGVSAGLQHFMTSGAIAEFTALRARLLYDTWAERDSTRVRRPGWTDQPYIGPAVYEAASHRIYFYSHLGVYAGTYGDNLTRLAAWHRVFTPSLPWRNGQPDAIGSPMNVRQLLSLGDGKLVLLTQTGSLGLWDGSTFRLLP